MNKLFALFLLLNAIPVPQLQAAITFSGPELLGKPTDTSITINVVPDANVSMYFEYGTAPGLYAAQTPTASAAAGESHEVVISGLLPNTQYYYRMQYAEPGDPGNWIARDEHSFWTQRPRGSTYAFTITSDSHINVQGLGVISQYRTALDRIATNHPDFNLDLGDTFNMDGVSTATQAYTNYLFQRSSDLMGRISPSIPIFLVGGNHENEEGWNFDDTYPQPIFSINARKRYFPTPIPDAFYSGNADASDTRISGDHLREDYYAWQWGDVLFVVIDPFQYTMNLPYDPVAGEGTDDTKTGDQWSWTLGAQQFNWLKATLQNSNAKYKFVFSHQMLGGITNGPIAGADAGYVRGGAEAAGNFEWGGNNADGTPGFSSHRNAADFGTKPIHQLMVENGVSAYFHGHDHQFVYEKRDGIVYQLVPSPCMGSGTGFNLYTQSPYVQTGGNLPNSGYLRITISPSQAMVDYVKTDNGSVAYSYTINPNKSTGTNYTITATTGANGGISPSGAVGVTAGGGQNFTITPDGGYGVADVLVDGVSQGAVTSYSFTNVVADHTISASFAGVAPAGNITYVGDVGSVSSNAAGTTLPIPVGAGGVAAGNTIVVGFASRGASPYNVPVVTDTAGNTYSLATNAISYQHGRSYIYYAHVKHSLVNGNKITITTSSVASRVAVASVFSGLLGTNLLDKTLANPTGTSTTAQGNNPTVGPTATTVQANELIIGVIGTEEATDAGVGTWQNSFTAGPKVKTSGASYEWRVSLGYNIVSATGQFTAAKTVANNPYWAAAIATFKAGAAPDTSAPILSTRPILLPNGHFHAGFTGTPNVPYTVEYADEITGPWQTLTNITSDGSGLIQVDAIPTAAPARRFYRVVYP